MKRIIPDSLKQWSYNQFQAWLKKYPDTVSRIVFLYLTLFFIGALVCLLLAELYLMFILVGLGAGSIGYFVFKNPSCSDENDSECWTSYNSIGNDLFPPDELSRFYDPAYRDIPGNIHYNDR